MNRHRNNFDLLRLLAASGVVAQHIVGLAHERALSFLQLADTKLALNTFFVISGYLVFMSFENTPRWRDYLDKRLRRILPAYVAAALLVMLLTALAWLSWHKIESPWLRRKPQAITLAGCVSMP